MWYSPIAGIRQNISRARHATTIHTSLTCTADLPVECQLLLQVNLPQPHPPQQTAAKILLQPQHCLALLLARLLLLPLVAAVMLLLLLLLEHPAEAFCLRVHLPVVLLLLLLHHLLLLVLLLHHLLLLVPRLECSQAREYHFPWHPCTRSR
jgi:hypothetical protein